MPIRTDIHGHSPFVQLLWKGRVTIKNRITRQDLLLAAIAVVLVGAVFLVSGFGTLVPTPCYDDQVGAALRMQQAMDAVKEYKEERGIPLSPHDIHETGLVGVEFNGLTTTLGDLEAKRTTANPDMAALLVLLLREAGVKPGDRVAAGFSGSFPAMNLAVLSACAQLEVELVSVSSVGSSTYGANTPGLSFPEMQALLIRDGYFPQSLAAVTLGGNSDTGGGMDPDLVAEIEARLEALGISVWREPDFQANAAQRMALYEAGGEIACFIGVGGNLISSGSGESSFPYGVVPPEKKLGAATERSGLMERYHALGVPVIHILNIKGLVAEYSLPLDPAQLPEPGTSGIYYQVSYPKAPVILALLVGLAGLLLYRHRAVRPLRLGSGAGGK